MELFPLSQVAADLTEIYELDHIAEKNISAVIMVMALNARIKLHDAHGREISPPIEIVTGLDEPRVTKRDVNIALARLNYSYTWRPLKKRGAKRSDNSLRAREESGEFRADVENAKTIVRNENPHNFTKSAVARKLIRNFPAYGDYSESYLVRHIKMGRTTLNKKG